ncbi:MAG: hypothetical protein Salg2KO_20630 [Salibacteraceae bacterium]
MFLLFSAGSQAQLIVTQTDSIVCETDTIWMTAIGYDSISWISSATLSADTGNSVYATGNAGSFSIMIK